jgi:hypothetical protein
MNDGTTGKRKKEIYTWQLIWRMTFMTNICVPQTRATTTTKSVQHTTQPKERIGISDNRQGIDTHLRLHVLCTSSFRIDNKRSWRSCMDGRLFRVTSSCCRKVGMVPFRRMRLGQYSCQTKAWWDSRCYYRCQKHHTRKLTGSKFRNLSVAERNGGLLDVVVRKSAIILPAKMRLSTNQSGALLDVVSCDVDVSKESQAGV